MSATWTGNISFGLVTVPVGLHKATEDKEIHLNLIHLADKGQVGMDKFCRACSAPVAGDQIGKGYKAADGSMVEITDAELDGLPLAAPKTCEVVQFVAAGAIEPMARVSDYFVQPREGGAMAFALLHGAMAQTGLVGLCHIRIRSRQQLAMLACYEDGLLLTTLHWPDEIRQPSFPMPEVTPRPQELKMAVSLVKTLAGKYDPAAFTDDYRDALGALVATKVAGHEVKPRSKAEAQPVSDIAAALRASLDAAKAAKPKPDAPLAKVQDAPVKARAPRARKAG